MEIQKPTQIPATTKTKGYKILITTIILIGAIGFIAPFVHKHFSVDERFDLLESEYSSATKTRNKQSKIYKKLTNDFTEGLISLDELGRKLPVTVRKYNKLDKIRADKKLAFREYEESIKINRFESMYTFLFPIGFSISMFVLCLLALYVVYSKERNKTINTVLKRIFSLYLIIPLFFFIQSFTTIHEYGRWVYYSIIIILALSSSKMLHSFALKIINKSEHIKHITKLFFSYINSSRKKFYLLASHSINEDNEPQIKDLSAEYENELEEVIHKVRKKTNNHGER